MGLVVNLDEFSELCGVSEVTMRKYFRALEVEPDWMIKRGMKGSDYQIEPVAALAWFKAAREGEEAANAKRSEQLAQLRFDLLGDAAGSEESMALSGRQRREEYGAEFERIRLRKEMGKLVDVEELAPLLMAAVVESRRRLGLVPGEFAALTGMTPEEVKPLAGLIERAIDEFVTAFSKAAVGSGDAPGGSAPC
jgi:hypothetical protein